MRCSRGTAARQSPRPRHPTFRCSPSPRRRLSRTTTSPRSPRSSPRRTCLPPWRRPLPAKLSLASRRRTSSTASTRSSSATSTSRSRGSLQERFMPEIGGALDAALSRISLDMKTDINEHGARLDRGNAAHADQEPAGRGGSQRRDAGSNGGGLRYNARLFRLNFLRHGARQEFRAGGDRRPVVLHLGEEWLFPGRPRRIQPQPPLHPAAAAQRHGHAAHGPRFPAHADGRVDALPPYARVQHAVAARHRSRRHRHPDRGRAPARSRGQLAPGAGPRSIRRARLEMEGGIRLDHHAPDAPARGLLRLGARALHHGRGAVAGGDGSVRSPARATASSTAASGWSTGTRC